MKGGIGNILKQAQAMQGNLRKAQEELAEIEVTGSSGGGMVSIVMTCRHEVRRVMLSPELLKDDREMVEDLITAALNDALKKVEQTTQQKMSGLTAGLNMPGMNLPF